jgi:hypothetical protein
MRYSSEKWRDYIAVLCDRSNGPEDQKWNVNKKYKLKICAIMFCKAKCRELSENGDRTDRQHIWNWTVAGVNMILLKEKQKLKNAATVTHTAERVVRGLEKRIVR